MEDALVRSTVQPVFATAGNVPDVDTSSDARNVQLAKQGDVRAFERLYRNNVGRVHALCLRMVADKSLAEELVQDVFVRAWRKIDSFRGQSAFSSWLHRLAVNVVLSEQRSRRRREARIVAVEDPVVHDKPRLGGPVGAGVDLERAIATLPPGARQIFVLHDIEGFNHREIAEITGLAVGTSKAHLHRARRLLREALNR
jgi:RNA polymerase sigma-70 factor (ECF subfamily)